MTILDAAFSAMGVIFAGPTADGTSGQFLSTNGAGVTSWATASAGAASTIVVVDSTDVTSFIAMFDSATGTLAIKTDGALLYDATTGMLSATKYTLGTNGHTWVDNGASSYILTVAGASNVVFASSFISLGPTVLTIGSTFGEGAANSITLAATATDALKISAITTTLNGGTSAAELRLLEPSGSGTNYTAFKTQAMAANVTYTLPAADGSSGQVLSTSGTGTLSWATAGSGAVATDSIWNTKGDMAVGTGADTAALLVASTNGFILSCDSAEATGLKWIAAPGGGDMLLGTSQVVTALKTFGAAGAVGKFAIAGTTSGSTVVDSTAAASGTLTLPAATDTLVGKATTDTLTNKRVTPRVTTQTDGASITPDTDDYDILYYTSATQSGTLTINADVGIPTNGQKWILKTKATNSLTFAWNAQLIGSTDLALPTATTAAKVDYFGFIWDAVASKWNLVAKTQGF